MNMTEAQDLINNGGFIDKPKMLEIIQIFRTGLRDVVYDLKEIDHLAGNDRQQHQNIPKLIRADWALDILIKTLTMELDT